MHNQEKSEAGEENTAEVGLPEVKFFSCLDCSKKFAEEKSLALHLRVYAGVKHFSCSLCLRSCVQLKHWETTMHIHTLSFEETLKSSPQ
jgi:hypothetical protein